MKDKRKPKIIILLATYNAGDYLLPLLDSIKSQIGVELKILTCDDGSTDHTVAIVDDYFKDGSCKRVHNSATMRSSSRNFYFLLSQVAFQYDEFDFIALCDQDDIWDENKLYEACLMLDKKRCSGYSCSTQVLDRYGDEKPNTLIQNGQLTNYDYAFEGAGQGCTFVLRRDLFLSFTSFLNNTSPEFLDFHYHDWAIYAVSRVNNYNWCFDSRVFLLYRQHGQNDTGARVGYNAIKFRIKKISSGWYIRQVRLLANCISKNNKSDRRMDFILSNRWLNPGVIHHRPEYTIAFTARTLLAQSRRRRYDRLVVTLSFLIGWFSK